jgi:hypothetical protein
MKIAAVLGAPAMMVVAAQFNGGDFLRARLEFTPVMFFS